jgi:hypothetical protein
MCYPFLNKLQELLGMVRLPARTLDDFFAGFFFGQAEIRQEGRKEQYE